MAENWKMNELYKIINGNDIAAIQDACKRFPLTCIAVAKGDLQAVTEAMPDYITVRKIEAVLKGDVALGVETVDGDIEEPKTANEESVAVEVEEKAEIVEKSEKVEKTADKPKGKRGRKPKNAEKAEAFTPVEELIDKQETSPYAGKSAVELFKECRSRGIKVEPKQALTVYEKLLVADDVKKAEAEKEDDWNVEDDWGDSDESVASETVEEPKADEDDDDWDI